MKDIKCTKCEKLFFKAKSCEVEIVCSRCKTKNVINLYSQKSLIFGHSEKSGYNNNSNNNNNERKQPEGN
jgi:phage FluMu protein Com